jgi:hypothetical protein
VFRQHLVVDCGRVKGTHAVTQDAGCSVTDTGGLVVENIVCRLFEASSLVLELPLTGVAKEGLFAVRFPLVL